MIVRLAYMGYYMYKGFSCEMHHGIAELVPTFWMSMWSIEALLRAGSADGGAAGCCRQYLKSFLNQHRKSTLPPLLTSV